MLKRAPVEGAVCSSQSAQSESSAVARSRLRDAISDRACGADLQGMTIPAVRERGAAHRAEADSDARGVWRGAFSILELIAVLIVLAVLVGIAAPRYFDRSTDAKSIAIATSLKTIRHAILKYRSDLGALPPDRVSADMPPELLPYLDNNVWMLPVQGIGKYNWDGPAGNGMSGWPGNEAIGVAVTSAPANPTTDPFWLGIDATIDDGNLTTGLFRWEAGSARYRLHIDPH